jgi:hypothetical protein
LRLEADIVMSDVAAVTARIREAIAKLLENEG